MLAVDLNADVRVYEVVAEARELAVYLGEGFLRLLSGSQVLFYCESLEILINLSVIFDVFFQPIDGGSDCGELIGLLSALLRKLLHIVNHFLCFALQARGRLVFRIDEILKARHPGRETAERISGSLLDAELAKFIHDFYFIN